MRILLWIMLGFIVNEINAKEISYEEFKIKLYDYSKEIIMQDALSKSLEAESKAMSAWDSPYVEISPSLVRNKSNHKFNTEAQVLLMLTPKMPWASNAIKESYEIKSLKNQKITQLQKNILEIKAKKMYLEYLIFQEQLEIYLNKEHLSKELYDVAKKKFDANYLSKAGLLRFQKDYLSATQELKAQKALVDSRLQTLRILLGDDDFQAIADLKFYYLSSATLESKSLESKDSLHNEILSLEAKDYQKSAKVLANSQMDALAFGMGYTFGQNSIDFKIDIPLPFTSKSSYEQKALLELQSASLKQNEISKEQMRKNITLFIMQLKEQEEMIALAIENQQNALALFEITQKGYDAGSINVFEYLETKNALLLEQIKVTTEKLNYINLLSQFEEIIGESLR